MPYLVWHQGHFLPRFNAMINMFHIAGQTLLETTRPYFCRKKKKQKNHIHKIHCVPRTDNRLQFDVIFFFKRPSYRWFVCPAFFLCASRGSGFRLHYGCFSREYVCCMLSHICRHESIFSHI